MEEPFDELSKILAEGVSRREAFRRAGGLLLGAVVASLGLDRLARADGLDCHEVCTRDDARNLCMENDCLALTGGRLRAFLARCIPVTLRNYRVDCNTCNQACNNELCAQDCFVSCRDRCRAHFFRPGHERNTCIAVCAQCIASHTEFCGNGSKRLPAHCCQNPQQICIQDRCQGNPCFPRLKPCFRPDGRLGDCCGPGEVCDSGACRQCSEARGEAPGAWPQCGDGLSFCGTIGFDVVCCVDFDPQHPFAYHEACCPATDPVHGVIFGCAAIASNLPPGQVQCCETLPTGTAFVCPSPDANGTFWKCCTPVIVTQNSSPGWCCPADSTCNPDGFPDNRLCL